jgi:hypothetical protein
MGNKGEGTGRAESVIPVALGDFLWDGFRMKSSGNIFEALLSLSWVWFGGSGLFQRGLLRLCGRVFISYIPWVSGNAL